MQQRLFDLPKPPRAKPRKLMHVIDAGPGIDDADMVEMKCRRCGHVDDWKLRTRAEVRAGVPCPICNPATEEGAE